MWKILLYAAGGILAIWALSGLARHLPDFTRLTPYGKGMVVGNLIFFLIGCGLLYAGYRRKNP